MKWLDIASTTTNNTAGGCDRQAMVVFRNRAYKPCLLYTSDAADE